VRRAVPFRCLRNEPASSWGSMKTRRGVPALGLGFVVLLAVPACGGGTSAVSVDAGVSQDVAAPDASSEVDAAPDAAVSNVPGGIITDDAQKIVVTIEGGFGPTAPKGSQCKPTDATYTLTLPARTLAWEVCVSKSGGIYDYDTESKTFSSDQLAPLSAALRAVAPSTKTTCGADKPVESVIVTTSADTRSYFDDFYACQDGEQYVTGLDAVVSELAKLSVAP
jgi:hypothetical protein